MNVPENETAQNVTTPMETTGLGLARPEYTMLQKLTLSWSIVTSKQGKHSYAGTVPAHVIASRRAKNKVAKASRKANR